ncbi:MAG: hypothetical protein WCA15_07260, partial [Candidatus Acidiferrales bacterium]
MSKRKKASRKAKSATKAKTAAKKQSVKTRASSGASDTELREYLAKVLTWGEAHADWKQALAGLDPAQRGVRPAGSPYSAWELL